MKSKQEQKIDLLQQQLAFFTKQLAQIKQQQQTESQGSVDIVEATCSSAATSTSSRKRGGKRSDPNSQPRTKKSKKSEDSDTDEHFKTLKGYAQETEKHLSRKKKLNKLVDEINAMRE